MACKKKLAENVQKVMTPIYERRLEWLKRPDDIKDIVREGNRRAREVASKTMEEVRRVMKIDWD